MLPTRDGEAFEGLFLLKDISENRTKAGKTYLNLTLGSSGGDMEGRMWDRSLSSLGSLTPGDVVRASGSGSLYQDRLQLKVEKVAREPGPVQLRDLFPSTERSEEDLRKEFLSRVRTLEDPHLKTLFKVIQDDNPFFRDFFTSPAALGMHHARIGGLAEHSLGTAALAVEVARQRPWLRGELLLAGSLLHDVGKVREFEVGKGFSHTLEGTLLGHITLGAMMLQEWTGRVPGFPRETSLELGHILLSHHGQHEFGSPKVPVTAEALVVHFCDDLDAKMDMLQSALRSPRPPGEERNGEYVKGMRRYFYLPRREGEPGKAGEGRPSEETAGTGPETSLHPRPNPQGDLF